MNNRRKIAGQRWMAARGRDTVANVNEMNEKHVKTIRHCWAALDGGRQQKYTCYWEGRKTFDNLRKVAEQR